MTNNTSKSEQPLVGKGLLYSEEETRILLTEDNKIQREDVDEELVRKSWEYKEVFDQKNTSMNVGCAWTTYLSTKMPIEELGMSEAEFAKSIYHESQTVDPWGQQTFVTNPLYSTEINHKYGTSVITAATILREQNFFKELVWTDDTYDLSNFILTKGAAIVASSWTSEMNNVDPNGFVRPNGAYEGNHCWLVYGVDDVWETFFALNSWGRQYGKDGKFLVKFADMKKILKDGFAIASI